MPPYTSPHQASFRSSKLLTRPGPVCCCEPPQRRRRDNLQASPWISTGCYYDGAVEVVIGALILAMVGLALVGTWMRRDRTPRWSIVYVRYWRVSVDQRFVIALAIVVDTILVCLGGSEGASPSFWSAEALLVGVQAVLIGVWLWVLSRRTEALIWRHILRP